MTLAEDWKIRLFRERSFSELYRVAKPYVSVKSNIVIAFCFWLILITILNSLGPFGFNSVLSSELFEAIDAISSLGVAYAASILGFLVSGFALFFAISRREVFLVLGHTKSDENSNISNLQLILYSFMYVFWHYILYMPIMFIIIMIIKLGGISLGSDLLEYSAQIYYTLNSVLLALVGAWTMFLFLLLKSFVWNLYQTILLAITIGDDIDTGKLAPLVQLASKPLEPNTNLAD